MGYTFARGVVVFIMLLNVLFKADVQAYTLKVGISDDIVSLDPARVYRHRLTHIVQSLMYTTLIEIDDDGNYKAGMADDFQLRDALTWEFTLSPDLKYDFEHIGRHFQRLIAPDGLSGFPSPAQERFQKISRVTTRQNKLVFHLSEPWAGLPSVLATEPVARVTKDGAIVTTGAFELERWDRGNRVVLKRKTPQTAKGTINRVWFEIIPSATTRLNHLLTGQIDIALDLPIQSVQTLQDHPAVSPITFPNGKVFFIELDVSRPPFNDVRVRRAFNLAVGAQNLKTFLPEGIDPIATMFIKGSAGYDDAVVPFGSDVRRGRELLSSAGYPNGFEFELDVLTSRRYIGEMYAEMLREGLGVDVVLRVWNDRRTMERAVRLERRHAWLTEWNTFGKDPYDVIEPKLHTTGEKNYGNYTTTALDHLLREAEQPFDPFLRLDHYRIIQRFIRQEAPYVFGFPDYSVHGVADHVRWEPRLGGAMALGEALFRKEL